MGEDKIGAWFIRAKTVENRENDESCPKEGCPSTNVLEKVPKLGSDDTVIVLLHGNAKVPKTYFDYFSDFSFQLLSFFYRTEEPLTDMLHIKNFKNKDIIH